MKRSNKLLILVCVLLVVCIATVVLTQYEEAKEEIQNSDAVLLAIPADTVDALSWSFTEGGLAFHKGEAGWLYDEDEAFPVSETQIADILSNFASFGVSFVIENVEDYSQYGLDTPEGTIRLTADGRNYEVRMGAFSKMDEQRYIDVGDGNVYLVKKDPMDYLVNTLSGMIEHDVTPGFEQVEEITFHGLENYTVVRTEDSPDTYNPEDIYFARLDGASLPLDTYDVTYLLNGIAGLELLNYATYNATAEELAAFGLETPELTVTVNHTVTDAEGNEAAAVCEIHIGRNAEEQAAYDAALEAEEALSDVTKYVRVGDSQIVYVLDEVDYLTLSAVAYEDLRHREVFWGDFSAVTQIDIQLEGEDHTLTAVTDEETAERQWYYGEEAVDIAAVQAKLESLTAVSFTAEAPTEKEELCLTLHLDNENFPQVEIRLYRYDGSLCLASVDGEPVSLVDRGITMDLVEAVQAIVLNG